MDNWSKRVQSMDINPLSSQQCRIRKTGKEASLPFSPVNIFLDVNTVGGRLKLWGSLENGDHFPWAFQRENCQNGQARQFPHRFPAFCAASEKPAKAQCREILKENKTWWFSVLHWVTFAHENKLLSLVTFRLAPKLTCFAFLVVSIPGQTKLRYRRIVFFRRCLLSSWHEIFRESQLLL